MNDNLAELKSKVLNFLEAEPGFELYKNEELRTFENTGKTTGQTCSVYYAIPDWKPFLEIFTILLHKEALKKNLS